MTELFYPRVIERAAQWHPELRRIKADNPSPDFTWYGYDILSNLWHIEGLLGESHANLLEAVRGQPLADIGAADGDLAYFFERQGFDVDVLDWPATNWNGLRGARRLHELLESSIGIHEVDLDSQFDLPRQRYGLVLLLGILYHLKNPFYVLETLAKHTRYCVLSTRIARATVDGAVALERAGYRRAGLIQATEHEAAELSYFAGRAPAPARYRGAPPDTLGIFGNV